MTRKIKIMDTTLRDGEQTQGVSFSSDEKLSLSKALLSKLKIDRIEVASARVSSGEKKSVSRIIEWASEYGYDSQVEILGFVDNEKSVNWIKSTGGKVINLLTKGSEKHCFHQLGKTLEDHLKDIKSTVSYAKDCELDVNIYLEDWSNGYINSPNYVYDLTEALSTLGISHFMLPDTLGVMSPKEVHKSLTDMVCRFPNLQFDFHPHNDYGLATANVMSAVDAGATSIHCTVNCLGERAGNVSLAEIAVVLKDKMNFDLNIDESHIVSVSQMVESFSGKFVASNAPILGSDVFTQTAGIHADGDVKGNLYVSKLYPERFARKRTYALGKMSGKASLQKNLDEIGVSLSSDEQQRVLDRIVEIGDSKQRITSDDLPFIIADVLESDNFNHVKLINCDLKSEWNKKAFALLTLEINGNKYSSEGEGNGGFDAFVCALEIILKNLEIKLPTLIDYKVHIPKGGQTNALTEASITWKFEDDKKTVTTRGMHANQVFAAIEATLRLVNRILHKKS